MHNMLLQYFSNNISWYNQETKIYLNTTSTDVKVITRNIYL
jgi:hypothetical protein